MGRRNRPEIIMDLLRVLVGESSDRRADGQVVDVSHRKLMRTANLNYQQLTTYLEWLEEEGLVVIEGDGRDQEIILTDAAMELTAAEADEMAQRRFLKEIDREILAILDEGRNTAANIAAENGYDRQHVYNRLMWLSEHGFVQNLGNGVFETVVEKHVAV